ncbi:YceI family protein [Flavobacterium sp. RSB2_4_14]|uniref:YceI family protein n=1 Tax=Flavobacterium sp. RSB2_4_14 TaxID=3447665 RepID=UPI003F3AE0AE
MKNFKTIAIALLVAFGTTVATAQNKKINLEKSNINWVGEKVTGKHTGTINFKDGVIIFQKNKLAGGIFTVNMASITVTDLKAGEGKEKLEGHLKADDFFGTEKFDTAKLEFKTIATKSKELYTVTADLTIKGITKPVTFDMTVKGNTATTTFKVDRTKYDIKYGSKSFFEGIGDKAIYDEFELTVALQF